VAEHQENSRLDAGGQNAGRQDTGPQETGRQETVVFPEDAAAGAGGMRKGPVDRVTLVVGVLFSALAVLVLAGVDLSSGPFWDDALLWVVLLGAGVALLVTELRRARNRR
jgi:hypothetical protein